MSEKPHRFKPSQEDVKKYQEDYLRRLDEEKVEELVQALESAEAIRIEGSKGASILDRNEKEIARWNYRKRDTLTTNNGLEKFAEIEQKRAILYGKDEKGQEYVEVVNGRILSSIIGRERHRKTAELGKDYKEPDIDDPELIIVPEKKGTDIIGLGHNTKVRVEEDTVYEI